MLTEMKSVLLLNVTHPVIIVLSRRLQLDVYGELLDAVYLYNKVLCSMMGFYVFMLTMLHTVRFSHFLRSVEVLA